MLLPTGEVISHGGFRCAADELPVLHELLLNFSSTGTPFKTLILYSNTPPVQSFTKPPFQGTCGQPGNFPCVAPNAFRVCEEIVLILPIPRRCSAPTGKIFTDLQDHLSWQWISSQMGSQAQLRGTGLWDC